MRQIAAAVQLIHARCSSRGARPARRAAPIQEVASPLVLVNDGVMWPCWFLAGWLLFSGVAVTCERMPANDSKHSVGGSRMLSSSLIVRWISLFCQANRHRPRDRRGQAEGCQAHKSRFSPGWVSRELSSFMAPVATAKHGAVGRKLAQRKGSRAHTSTYRKS